MNDYDYIGELTNAHRMEFHDEDGEVTVLGSGIDNLNFVMNHSEVKIIEGELENHIPEGNNCYGSNGYPACPFWQGSYCAYLDKTDADTIGNRVKACDVNKREYPKEEK